MTPVFSLTAFVAVGVGAAIGAWTRWFFAVWLNDTHKTLPVGTLVANLVGGLLIGMALAALSRHPDLAPAWRLAMVTGFLGALTTFSTFSAESLAMIQRGEYAWALGHTLLHLIGCLLAAAIGYRVIGG